jgi:phosphate:Na+ symporter
VLSDTKLLEMNTALLIVTGLVLFLYALNNLSQGLSEISSNRLKSFLNRFTNSTFKGIISGIPVTILLDSSSVVIIMTIALVNSYALTFRQAMGVVMGANIGTTFSSQIFALNIGQYAAIPIAAGFILMFFFKKPFQNNLGKVIFSFGLIFFGLSTMEEAVEPLRQSSYFVGWLQSLENLWRGLLTGTIVTIILQSSSATVGIIIGLGSKGLISITGAIAIMLGAELGTCADTLVATVGRSRAAIKTGIFHLLFNICTIILGMLLLPFFTELVLFVSRGASLSQTIANAHILFNCLGVLIMLPFVPLYEKFLVKIFPERKKLPGFSGKI